jgi:hypothetical protein
LRAFLSNLSSSSSSATGCPAFVEPAEVIDSESLLPFLKIGEFWVHHDK